MKDCPTRRSFIKKAGFIAGVFQIPLHGWANGFGSMRKHLTGPGNEFSMLKLTSLLPGYEYPLSTEFSVKNFELKYRLCNLYGEKAVLAGEFFINCRTDGNDPIFDFTISRQADTGTKLQHKDFKYIVSGHIECRSDQFQSVKNWDVFSRIALSGDEEPFPGTGLINKGLSKNEIVSIATQGRPIEKKIGKLPLVWKWGIPSIAQNLAFSDVQQLDFSVLDEFDSIHTHQCLKFRRKVSVECNDGSKIDFKVFQLTGEGVIPVDYWVDHLNRTVFIIGGMEAYILQSNAI